jgi:hypothetical protein
MIVDNGTTVFERGNHYLAVFASAVRDANENSPDLQNLNCRGVAVAVDITAESGTHAVVVKIQGKDEVSGKYYDILTSASLDATGTTVLRVYPGIAAASNVSASDILPRVWRVTLTHTKNASSTMTMSVGACLIR